MLEKSLVKKERNVIKDSYLQIIGCNIFRINKEKKIRSNLT